MCSAPSAVAAELLRPRNDPTFQPVLKLIRRCLFEIFSNSSWRGKDWLWPGFNVPRAGPSKSSVAALPRFFENPKMSLRPRLIGGGPSARCFGEPIALKSVVPGIDAIDRLSPSGPIESRLPASIKLYEDVCGLERRLGDLLDEAGDCWNSMS